MKTVEEEFSYQGGQSVTILYDEKSPRHPFVKGDKEPKMVWQNYLVFAIVSFVIVAIVFVVTMPSTLDFTNDQRNLHGMMLHMVLFLTSFVVIIVYPHTKEYKKRRENGISTKKELVSFALILGKFGLDLVFDIKKI